MQISKAFPNFSSIHMLQTDSWAISDSCLRTEGALLILPLRFDIIKHQTNKHKNEPSKTTRRDSRHTSLQIQKPTPHTVHASRRASNLMDSSPSSNTSWIPSTQFIAFSSAAAFQAASQPKPHPSPLLIPPQTAGRTSSSAARAPHRDKHHQPPRAAPTPAKPHHPPEPQDVLPPPHHAHDVGAGRLLAAPAHRAAPPAGRQSIPSLATHSPALFGENGWEGMERFSFLREDSILSF
jgi:hypothetical protein